MLQRKDPVRSLHCMADKTEEGVWKVKTPDEKARTEVGRRTFSSRVKRIWSILTEEEKVMNIKNKNDLRHLQRKIKNLDEKVKNWILWGKRTNKDSLLKRGTNGEEPDPDDTEDTGNGTFETNIVQETSKVLNHMAA